MALGEHMALHAGAIKTEATLAIYRVISSQPNNTVCVSIEMISGISNSKHPDYGMQDTQTIFGM
jgi:hypothetical protein